MPVSGGMGLIEAADWEKETAWLARVCRELERQEARLDKEAQVLRQDFASDRHTRKQDFRRPASTFDFDALMEWAQLEQDDTIRAGSHAFLRDQQRRLAAMWLRPYFGRIDWLEAGVRESESLYIGIHSLLTEDGEALVYDWRAPVSSLFYDAEPGPAAYRTPTGVSLPGTLTGKRQYIIEAQALKAMFDTDVAVRDALLQEALGRAEGSMRSIVATIAREQNQVIRDETRPVLVVSGPAGSGKTSVVMQRAAYLLYQHRAHLTARQIAILSPNRAFADYISRVLPELGEEPIAAVTLRELAGERFDRRERPGGARGHKAGPEQPETEMRVRGPAQLMEDLLDKNGGEQRRVIVQFKRSSAFLRVLQAYAERLGDGDIRFPDACLKGRAVVTADELRDIWAGLPPRAGLAERLETVRRHVRAALQKAEQRRAEAIRQRLLRENRYVGEDGEIAAMARRAAAGEIRRLKAQLARGELFDPLALYTRLCTDADTWRACTVEAGIGPAHGQADADGLGAIREWTAQRLCAGEIGHEDAGALLWLAVMTRDELAQPQIRHVLVDEAQDYSAVDLAALRAHYPLARFTMAGDDQQAIFPGGQALAEAARLAFGQEAVRTVSLVTAYRSTVELTRFCRALLRAPETSGVFERHGERPKLRVTSPEELARWLPALLRDASVRHRSVAVIGRNLKSCAAWQSQLPDGLRATLLTDRSDVLPKGLVVTPAYLAKGLEFECVAALDVDRYDPFADRHLFYTVCTRALNELWLCSAIGTPAVLAEVPEDCYALDPEGV